MMNQTNRQQCTVSTILSLFSQDSLSLVDEESGILWFAGKQMMREHTVSKYIGANEKQIILVKLTKKGSQAPARQPAVDEETRKKMMSHWHKQQEMNKQLEQDDDDAFMNSSWANPKAIKSSTMGIDSIRYRPGMH